MVVETDQDNDFTLSANVAAHCGWDTHRDNLPRGYHGRYADLGDRVVIMVTAVITMTLTAMFAAGKDNVKMIEDAMSMVMMEIMITVIAVLTMVMAADAMMTEGAAAMVVVSIMDTVVQPPLFNVTCEICNIHVHPESNFWWVYRDDSDDDGNGDEKGAHVASYIVGTNWFISADTLDVARFPGILSADEIEEDVYALTGYRVHIEFVCHDCHGRSSDDEIIHTNPATGYREEGDNDRNWSALTRSSDVSDVPDLWQRNCTNVTCVLL
ncbi:hypothetical protein QYE76_065187 [Lolium multiflorum]|uniref:Uncharacterized protein n=1 Tax=Lolium multiflorum TaxID=4521 RepID=A0AAD8SAJ4_LOLMU|nr:hypothetical protein QYE76_065187 [Lolium multiflorum]